MLWRALVLGLITGFGHGFFYFGVSAFVKPWGTELGLSRSLAASAVALGRFNAGWVTLLAGGLADRWGPRRVAVTGCAMTALGLAGSALCAQTWQLALCWGGLAGVGVALAFTVVLDKALMAQYPASQHGRALGWRFAAISVASFVAALVAGLLTDLWSWRVACGIWSVVMAGCVLLLLRLIPPSPRRQAGPGASVTQGMTLGEALRTADFWQLAVVSAIATGTMTGVITHLAALLTDLDVPTMHAAVLVSLTILLSMPGRLLAGSWADRWSARRQARGVAVAMAVQGLALAWLGVWPSTVAAYAFPVVFGVATGIHGPMLIVSPSRRFGTRHYGAIQGAVLLVQSVLTVIIPVALGAAHDRFGDYRAGVLACALLLLAASGLSLRLRLGADVRS